MENKDVGLLLDKQNITLHREYFKEMVRLIGINVLYRKPKMKDYDQYGELDANYMPPEIVGCIFEEHPTIWTMKKLGWVSELSTSTSLIHVPYDLEGLQRGCLFIVPSGLDNTEGRVFKVIRLSTTLIFPASITCEIGPVFESSFAKVTVTDFDNTEFNLLSEENK